MRTIRMLAMIAFLISLITVMDTDLIRDTAAIVAADLILRAIARPRSRNQTRDDDAL